MAVWLVVAVFVAVTGAAVVLGYRGLVSGALTVDTGWGRRVRPLGPLTVSIAAPEAAVAATVASVKAEAERRTAKHRPTG